MRFGSLISIPSVEQSPEKRALCSLFNLKLSWVEHPSTLIIPLTTNLVEYAEPLRIRVPASGRLRRESDLLVDQIRAIDNKRMVKGPIARLGPELMAQVREAILETLDLV